jgi:hypothetical protein
MLCKTVVTKDRRYITQITCYEKGSEKASELSKGQQQGARPLTYGKQTNGGALASLFSFPSRSSSLTRTRNQLKQQFLSSGTSNADTPRMVIDVTVSKFLRDKRLDTFLKSFFAGLWYVVIHLNRSIFCCHHTIALCKN